MGAPAPELNDEIHADESSAEAFTGALRTISPPERRKHANVYNYWMSIRRDREFPPIRDLDPLEISEAGPNSLLLEMVGGGEDARIRHIGVAIKGGVSAETVAEAPNPSLLSCIAERLPVVAGCRAPLAFEEEFETDEGKLRCWVTLLPFSATGTWIDYVYGFVTLDSPVAGSDAGDAALEEEPATEVAEPLEEFAHEDSPTAAEPDDPAPEIVALESVDEAGDLPPPEALDPLKPTISEKFFEKLANIGGFYGRPVEIELDPETVNLETWEADEPQPETPILAEAPSAEEFEAPVVEEVAEVSEELEPPVVEEAPEAAEELEAPVADEAAEAAEEPQDCKPTPEEPSAELEGTLESKLTEVRAKADEARQAKLRANAALYEGLSAAYDFALDAEDSPEEYLKLVQAEGLKIQLRSPMKPVAKLAFDGMCDDMTIQQLEAILAWAFDEELPRGTLAERIEQEGGVAPILSRYAAAA